MGSLQRITSAGDCVGGGDHRGAPSFDFGDPQNPFRCSGLHDDISAKALPADAQRRRSRGSRPRGPLERLVRATASQAQMSSARSRAGRESRNSAKGSRRRNWRGVVRARCVCRVLDELHLVYVAWAVRKNAICCDTNNEHRTRYRLRNRGSSSLIWAMPFTRSRFGRSKSRNSKPTWALTSTLPQVRYMPLPS